MCLLYRVKLRHVDVALCTERARRTNKQQHLWQFLLETLSDPRYNPCYIEWLDRSQGIFRFVESQKIARLWGQRRKRHNLSYEYFSRAMRSASSSYHHQLVTQTHAVTLLSIHPSILPSIHPPTHPSIHPSMYLVVKINVNIMKTITQL